MALYEIVLISIALSMDAFAVSICKGLEMPKTETYKAFIIALWFGLFQSLMPAIGFFLGSTFEEFVLSIDHWIAFILLFMIGINMIKECNNKTNDITLDISFSNMLLLAIATSIDALAIGIAYACAYNSYRASLTFVSIGIITFLISFTGVVIGSKVGIKIGKYAKIFGGLILIFIGFKILLTHLLNI